MGDGKEKVAGEELRKEWTGMAQELLTLQNLAKYYTSAQSVVVGLNPTNLTFCRGEFVAITGESGSGKSTLAHVLGGILPYEGGELLFKGKPTSHYDSGDWERYRRDCVSFISQNYGILPGSSVIDNVTCALRLVGVDKAAAQEKAEEILKRVELWDLRRRRAAKLSSGQKQRLSIARALAKPAPVLIADEPTGNLDAENSAMVIALLSEAAKDRLVILITHEFSEAADSVTRHIELHDGRVTMDVRLREAPEPAAPASKTAKGEGKKGLSWFVARFQIKARPVWAVLMLCLFAAAVFAMFAITGTFIANLDDTFTYNYDNSAFRNGDERRIVVAGPGGGEFSVEDIDKLRGLRYVESVEEYGYVTDIQYAYREGVDYEVTRVLTNTSTGLDPMAEAKESYSVRRTQGYMPFMRTIPTLPEGVEFLTAGRMPENLYEVVAVGGEDLLGQTMTVLIQDQKNWGPDDLFHIEVTVVGVTNYGEHLYFHEDIGKILTTQAKAGTNDLYLPLEEGACIVGPRFAETNGYIQYQCVTGGIVTRTEDVEEGLKQRAIQMISKSMEYMDNLVEDFDMDDGTTEWFVYLHALEHYAAVWDLGDELLTAMQEVGLDDDTLFGTDDEVWRTSIRDLLMDPQISAKVNAAAEPVFQTFKAAYAQKKEELLARDLNALSLDEVLEVLKAWWGKEEVPGITMNPLTTNTTPHQYYFSWDWGEKIDADKEIHPIEPGTVVISDSALVSIETDLMRGVNRGKPFENVVDVGDENGLVHTKLPTPDGSEKDFAVLGTTDTGHRWAILVHPEDFEELLYLGKGGQVSVTVEDYAYVDRVLEAIHALGFGAISPYQEGAVSQNEELAEQRMQTLRVCLLALVAVIALQILLLRAMFSMETESYRLLSHIGLNGATAQRSVFWQIMLFAIGGQLLGVGLIGACTSGGVEQLIHILRYLPLSYRVVLCLIHLGASAFTAVWSMKALKKQVFPQSGAEPDLDWDVLDEEVEA